MCHAVKRSVVALQSWAGYLFAVQLLLYIKMLIFFFFFLRYLAWEYSQWLGRRMRCALPWAARFILPCRSSTVSPSNSSPLVSEWGHVRQPLTYLLRLPQPSHLGPPRRLVEEWGGVQDVGCRLLPCDLYAVCLLCTNDCTLQCLCRLSLSTKYIGRMQPCSWNVTILHFVT